MQKQGSTNTMAKLKVLLTIYLIVLAATLSLIFYFIKKDINLTNIDRDLAEVSINSTSDGDDSLIKDTLLAGEKLSKIKNYNLDLTCNPIEVNLINCVSESTIDDEQFNFSFNYKTSKYPYMYLSVSADSSRTNYYTGSVKLADGKIKSIHKLKKDIEAALIIAEFREKLESKM